MPHVIEARSLVKRYGAFTALNGIDFHVDAGECFGLLGANGAGKTSTSRLISCVSPVTAGELTVMGFSVRTHPREIKARLGVVPQHDNLDPDMGVLDNLLVYARYFDLPRDERSRRATEVLRLMEMEHRAQASIDTLSGGMRRRLLIARALLNRPEALVLDEPTTGLDPHARRLVWQRLHELKAQGATMVLSTHYMEEAAILCDRIAVMDRGRILDTGSPPELIARHASGDVLELRLPPWEKERVQAAWGVAPERVLDAGDALVLFGTGVVEASWGVAPERIVRRAGTLEDVFLLLAGKGLDAE